MEFDPKFPDAYVCLALIEIAKGRSAKAIEAYQKLAPYGSYEEAWASIGIADLVMYEGRLNDAKKILEKAIPKTLQDGYKYSAAHMLLMLSRVHILQDKNTLAEDAADRAVAASTDDSILYAASQIYIKAGKKEKAQNLITELSECNQSEPQAYARLIEGEISLVKGNTAEAIKLFKQAQGSVDTWLGHLAMGRAYLEGEEYIEAHSEFELCLKRYGETTSVFFNDLPSFHYYPPIHYFYARTQEALNSPGAKASYKKFLKIKEKTDNRDPMIEDARRLNSL